MLHAVYADVKPPILLLQLVLQYFSYSNHFHDGWYCKCVCGKPVFKAGMWGVVCVCFYPSWGIYYVSQLHLYYFPLGTRYCFFCLRPSYFKQGSVLLPPGSADLQLPCLSLISLQTKTCSRTHFDREEKFIPALGGTLNRPALDANTCLFFCVTSLLQRSRTGQLKTYEIHIHA